MRLISKLTDSEKLELKKGVIEVSGKHMNRTALGIVDAMLQLYPSATFEELKELLPDTLNPSAPKNYKSLFKPYTDRLYGVIQSGDLRKEYAAAELDLNTSHFTGEGEVFRTQDGTEVLVSKTWESKDTETGSHDLQNLIDHVSRYGVRVVSFEAKGQSFTKGGYHLKTINPGLLKKLTETKKSKKYIWIILILLLLGACAAYFLLKNR